MKEEDIKAYSSALATAVRTEKIKVEKVLIIEGLQTHGQWRLRVYDGRNLVYTAYSSKIESARDDVAEWISDNYTVIGG